MNTLLNDQHNWIIFQIAFIVEDIERAAIHWKTQLNIGPFFRVDSFSMKKFTYDGSTGDAQISIALASAGDIQIELIELNNDENSVFRETLNLKGYGFHHSAVIADDIDEKMQYLTASNCELASESRSDGSRIAFFRDASLPGQFIELVEGSKTIRTVTSAIKEASERSSKRESVRSFSELKLSLDQ
jgi:hypothetical protein